MPSLTPDAAPPTNPGPESAPEFGGLTLAVHARPGLAAGAPLVVLLHGCSQDPESFAVASGWRDSALEGGFVLAVPGQSAQRNAQTCFNWFDPAQRSGANGEVALIRAMIEHVVTLWRCDRRRVHIVGLSAGGAMAALLMAVHPDLFAAGAVVAGLPAGAANGVVDAMTRMAGRGTAHSDAVWARRARDLAGDARAGPWPRLLIWHGTGDRVVDVGNGRALAAQWCALHGLAGGAAITKLRAVGEWSQWRSSNGDVIVSLFLQNDWGHAYPVRNCVDHDPFVLDSDISATDGILAFWNFSNP